MLWNIVKPGPDFESMSLSRACFKQWADRKDLGGEASNLGAKGRKAIAKETKKRNLAEET